MYNLIVKKIGSLIDKVVEVKRPKNLSTDFQVYGVYLCEALGDSKNYPLYIKLAKLYDRALLEMALNFCKDYPAAKSKPRLFMWKLKQLRKAAKESSSKG